MSAYGIVVAWILVLAVLALIAQTQAGARLIYGVLFLAIVLLVLTQYQAITSLLKPIGTAPA